ncbi:MAG: hypothetical protein P0Y49_21735 [Candidatus Pedobacter colombiensis]|uniref:Uncharacterized protein n=1 Tax=Candidatus Pedobacter colombiensis TaxID=3121371 RepID=A0AAJ5W895_9SPHI|nr:hypothetical protein [Pedobacter sp.]WEK19400.1 MAG: hypothetical protein P0Y49_21735 [Pedobacter sp.]
MKKILILMTIMTAFLLQSCDKKGPGDNYDFSNSLPPYVALTATTPITVKKGTVANVSFLVKTAIQQAVTITYKVEGAVNLPSQTVVLPRGVLTTTIAVPTVAAVITPPATSTTATLTLLSAVKADGTVLTIGSKNNPADQKVLITIN